MSDEFEEERKRRFSPLAIVGMVIGGLALAVLLAFLFGWIVMLLWNWLMPVIFKLPRIGYWQAWGLVLLSHILIKPGLGGHEEKSSKRTKHKDRGEWRKEFRGRFGNIREDTRADDETRTDGEAGDIKGTDPE